MCKKGINKFKDVHSQLVKTYNIFGYKKQRGFGIVFMQWDRIYASIIY